MTGSRIAAFVSAARSLLVVQVVAALLAVGVTAWAFFEVRGVIAERDQLRARVAELEAQAAQPQQPLTPLPLGPDPAINQILPPDVLMPPELNETVPVTVPETGNVAVQVTPPGTTAVPPGNTATPQQPGRWNQQQPTTRPQLDCEGADRGRPGCRPIPERPPIQQLPDRLTPRGEPLAPQPQPQSTPPRGN